MQSVKALGIHERLVVHVVSMEMTVELVEITEKLISVLFQSNVDEFPKCCSISPLTRRAQSSAFSSVMLVKCFFIMNIFHIPIMSRGTASLRCVARPDFQCRLPYMLSTRSS